MFEVLPCLLCDGYKIGHPAQFPEDMRVLYSNFTARKSRRASPAVLAFGFQYLTTEYLVDQFQKNFFNRDLDWVMAKYKRRIDGYLGPNAISFDHIEALHNLGYLPLHLKAVPEGTLVPHRVPLMTIRNTGKVFGWLTNNLETLLSNVLWLPMTSATTALGYRRVFERYAKMTGSDRAFVPWQGHDFSYRGMAGLEAAVLSGAAHLLSFTGTDTLPAIDFLEQYYLANSDKELVAGSVSATEHSVMSMGMKEGELKTIERLITKVRPDGIISIVSDTWDLFKVLTEYLPQLREAILTRNGKVVIRPDSGDPVKIICGDPSGFTIAEQKGAIRLLWEVFGGTLSSTGHKLLDPHIGLIYGDSITPERQEEILGRLYANGFASSNVVLGIGSYTYQHVTRDTEGFAMKATYGETESLGAQAIYKDPKTDDGTKKSARGLLTVERVNDRLVCLEDRTWAQEKTGELQTIFVDGEVRNLQSLAEIRARVEAQL